MRFFLGMMLGLAGWYLKRYRPSPRHRYRPGDLADREWDEAIKSYRRAIELNPEDASFQLALATSYERLEKRAEASAAYAEYLRLSPSGAETDKVRARVAELSGSDAVASPAPAGRGISQD